MQTITRLEELSLNSWPALASIHYDGWIIRLADRFTDRSNSVWPLYESTLDPEQKISRCESLYGGFRQPAVFRINTSDFPLQLDRRLQDLGYSLKTITSVQTRRIDDLSLDERDGNVNIDTTLTDDWSDDVSTFVALGDRKSIYHRILGRIMLPTAYATLRIGSSLAAIGLGVLEDGHLGIYGMVTHPTFRRQGLARRVLNSLLNWARSCGASVAYLHVEEDNTPALSLYEAIGFEEVYQYWYRVQPGDFV
ncbi:MAG: GNAT family N-acetyltransferase [Candidatus Zixiibacteriota bacterium]|nr:MAG: GNAT family N-acetyltransferase [candidate division Zixibacteria bacterium]